MLKTTALKYKSLWKNLTLKRELASLNYTEKEMAVFDRHQEYGLLGLAKHVL